MIEQGSEEWFRQRLGKLTASRVADALARTKTGWSASRANLMSALIIERITGQPTEAYTNDAMRWGIETEPQARDAYCFYMDCEVEQVGFIDHPEIAMSGASPDGLVGADGLLEIKCPNSATHLEFMLSGIIPGKYQKQMTWQLACTQRTWCDYISFDPRFPADLQFRRMRFVPKKGAIDDMETEVSDFLGELDAKLAKLQKLRTP